MAFPGFETEKTHNQQQNKAEWDELSAVRCLECREEESVQAVRSTTGLRSALPIQLTQAMGKASEDPKAHLRNRTPGGNKTTFGTPRGHNPGHSATQ